MKRFIGCLALAGAVSLQARSGYAHTGSMIPVTAMAILCVSEIVHQVSPCASENLTLQVYHGT